MIESKQVSSGFALPCKTGTGGYMLKIVLCDDNTRFLEAFRVAARKILDKNHISAAIYTYECAEAGSPDLWQSADIFFLDIDFPEKTYNGIDIARRIRTNNHESVIVFVTNYVQYSPEGYEVQAFRYLLKDQIQDKLESYLMQCINKLNCTRETLQISISGEIILIPLNDILYIESQKHLAIIHVLKKGNKAETLYQYYESLCNLDQKLYSKGFLRVQKSYIVNMRRIQKYQCSEVRLDSGVVLPASEKNYSEQKKKYLLWKGAV